MTPNETCLAIATSSFTVTTCGASPLNRCRSGPARFPTLCFISATPGANGEWRERSILENQRCTHHIIHTIVTALTGHSQLDAERLGTWVVQRHAQIEQGVLVYIAHQLDILACVPAPMGERLGVKP